MDMWNYTKKKYKKDILIREQLGIILIENKIRKNRLRWYENVLRRHPDVIVRKCIITNVSGIRRDKEKSKKILIKFINKDLSILNLTKYITFFISQWRQKTHVADAK